MLYLPNGLALGALSNEAMDDIQKIFSDTGAHDLEGNSGLYEEVSKAFD
jgi:hypothetical protein